MSSIMSLEGVEQQPLKLFTEQAYLDYSMYVILDRALPYLADGLKPVQRRIIFAMSELGLSMQAKFKKSARTVGDVLGKFHPHGDTACYEAMVLMAQSFSYRYPFIDGQGNWGSLDDPKSFAAMRYTEARLSRYSELVLKELGQGTVDWMPNFDGTLDEPKAFPARVPNILLNGTSGIAVGMATDIPPHNLREVINACCHLLEQPGASVDELMQFILGPDFPTDAFITTSRSELAKIYKVGTGSIRMRARYIQEEQDIVITALPHMVSGSKILEQIADLMQAKKCPQVVDLRDESDHENPTRLIVVPRNHKTDVSALMNQLFAMTDLERTYRVNLNMVGLDGRPRVKSLDTILSEWLSYRIHTVRRRLETRLEKVQHRLHILQGFLIAYSQLEKIIQIIRDSDKPKPALMTHFKLSEIQADAILDMKLRHLARLEEQQIQQEQKALTQEHEDLSRTLNSDKRLKTLVKKELQEDAKTYGDDRRAPLYECPQAQAVNEAENLPQEPITIVLSDKGWVRAGKGHELDPTSLNYKSGDSFKFALKTLSDQMVVFLDSNGRAYSLPANSFPSIRGQGEPLTGRVNTPEGAYFAGLIAGADETPYLMLADNAYGFQVPFKELLAKNRNGKAIIKVAANHHLIQAISLSAEHKRLALLTNDGQLLIVPTKLVPVMSKGKGSKLLALAKNQSIIAACAFAPKSPLTLLSGRRKLVLSATEQKAYLGALGAKAQKLPKGYGKCEGFETT